MTGDRCCIRRKMLDLGEDTEEKPCPISRVPSKIPAKENETIERQRTVALDFYTQARKCLCERSPFDNEETQVSSTVLTLPTELANCLSRHLDGRKRHKKSHSGVEAKSSGEGGIEKPHKLNIWVETEEYLRELTVDDIDKLHELSSFNFPDSQKCFSIPVIGNVVVANEVNDVNANGLGSNFAVVVNDKEVDPLLEIDSVGTDLVLQEENGCSSSQGSGVEWLLGSKSKIHLTSERPSKKRKLLGGDAGLDKLLVACPVDGLSSLCHYCGLGDTGDQLNWVIVCSSCNVAVHKRCYGVQDDITDSWLCSWCKQRSAVRSSDRPCLLCPRSGGALKPVSKRGVGNENGGSVEFAHLFCCQWMPEVYIQSTKTMEPIMNIDGIKETRRKLICYLCKVKYGTCIRCSNGTCRTSFHPLCAREARHRMEIWGKLGCVDVELWAFCSKHSEILNGCSIQQSGDKSMTVASVPVITKHEPVTQTGNIPHKLKIGLKNGDKVSVQLETTHPNIGKSGNTMLHEGLSDARSNSRLQPGCGGRTQGNDTSERNAASNSDPDNTLCSVVNNNFPDPIKAQVVSSSFIHPLIENKMIDVQNAVVSKNVACECEGSVVQEIPCMEASSSYGPCNEHVKHLDSCDIPEFDRGKLEHLAKARNMGVLEMHPEDEVEGEIIFHQHRLLCNLVARKCISDDLICKVMKSLPQEIDYIGKHRWDTVLANEYLSELREAKKRGRKERRHKEAQAVLAAANAAAATSLRVSSFRKDTPDESARQETLLKLNHSTGRPGLYSQQMPRAKETLSKIAVSRVSSKIKSEFGTTSDFSKEHPRTCDICRRSDTFFNSILMCSNCKVAVHLDCYRSVKYSTGPWYCELCEDILFSRFSGAPAPNSSEKPYFAAECGFCGGSAGAFRKSIEGKWIHAFCAEWVLDATFRRGQVNPVEGMESVLKGSDVCYICHRKQGVCIKCNYGHCQSTFHPTCGRSAGCYMNTKTSGSKFQHKAYCQKHSLEQRAKLETQGHGVEELKSLKKIRVELERLRLLCERIVKREKLKRELIFCSHEVLVSNRDSVSLSALVRSPFSPPAVSLESATTSLKGSCSEAIQKSDDITIDSTVSRKRRIKFPVSTDSDQKTDDSSTSQNLFMQKPKDRVSFSGKQIPHRKHTETFEKELVMTSDQACMKNQRLPKGFVYVPVRCLSKEKEPDPDTFSGKPSERDG